MGGEWTAAGSGCSHRCLLAGHAGAGLLPIHPPMSGLPPDSLTTGFNHTSSSATADKKSGLSNERITHG